MLLAYVDESGDSGYEGSRTYTLGCVFLPAAKWPGAFDNFISFRRFLHSRFGVRVRAEIKSNYLVGGRGPCTGLGDQQRRAIYRQHLRLASKIDLEVFAVVIEKQKIINRSRNPRNIAWEFLLQRLERTSGARGAPIFLMHDEGDTAAIRKLARKSRRAAIAGSRFGTGHLDVPFSLLIDDPSPRNSAQSYFIQLADLCAYAAFRRIHPPPSHRGAVCPQQTWDELGTAIFGDANALARGTGTGDPVGIVI